MTALPATAPSRAGDASLADRLGGILGGPPLPGAACARRYNGKPIHDPELWFAPHQGKTANQNQADITAAKSICRHCPARLACLEYALAFDPQPGVWAGYTEQQRAIIRRDRKKGAA